MISASAPGKVILLGEHAVVYGQPALAVPVSQVRATATVEAAPPGSGLTLIALDLERTIHLEAGSLDDPLAAILFHTLARLEIENIDAVVTVTSDIPIAGGMGSGAAVSASIVRALSQFVGAELSLEEMSGLVYEVEKLHHGTPSGIDNTVVVYERPVRFVRGEPVRPFPIGRPFRLLIADTGIPSPTHEVVGAVRRKWEREPARYDFLFDRIGDLVEDACRAVEEGNLEELGFLMDQNHEILQEMGVSSPELDGLVEVARLSGALGAKLSGAGRGGSIVALVEEDVADEAEDGLRQAGAARVIFTLVE